MEENAWDKMQEELLDSLNNRIKLTGGCVKPIIIFMQLLLGEDSEC